jgi:hypothetical protein
MSKQIQRRRGSSNDHAAFVGAQGEFTYDTDTKRIVAHDGLTPGGFSAMRVDELGATGGSALVGYTPSGVGAVGTSVQSKLRETMSVKDFGAHSITEPGYENFDSTEAIQAAIDSGANVFVPQGIYRITSALCMVKDGQSIYGESKFNTIITNTTTSAVLFQFGRFPDSVGNRAQFCSMRDMRFVGNALTTEGISILSIIDDGTTGAARDVSISNVRIDSVGAGFALRASAWELYCEGLTVFTCSKGILLGSEVNSCTFVNTYISNCTNEAISMPVSAGVPSVVEFVGLTAQYSGGTSGTIDLGEAYAITFRGVYLEGNKAPANIYVGSGVKNCSIDGVVHNLVTGTSTRVIRAVDVKVLTAKNIVNLGGAVESLVRIEGSLPLSYVEGLFVAAGSVSVNELDDQSTRKATIWNDPLGGRQGVTDFYAPASQSNARMVDSAAGNVLMDFFNGRIYFGAQGAVPNFRRSGSTVALFSDDGTTYGNFRPLSLTLGANNVRIFTGTGSPEGVQTADVGSLFLRTDGGAGTTLYVKETGTGTTGWVAK